jgi:hypothetical protein
MMPVVSELEDQPYQWSPFLSSMDKPCCCMVHGLQTLEQLRHITTFLSGATDVCIFATTTCGMFAALQ